MKNLSVYADTETMAHGVADWLLDLVNTTNATFAIALSGGSTPRRLYQLLAAPPYRGAMPWSRVQWFWGDERFVPADDPRNNAGMVRATLFPSWPPAAGTVHPIPTEGLRAKAAALAYENELKGFYGAGRLDPARPLFDVTLLGLGADGHTASLFPGSRALLEQARWVVAVSDPGAETRISLTYPALESSRHVAFLVAGAEKRSILGRFLAEDPTLPASRLRPVGAQRVFTDAAAAP